MSHAALTTKATATPKSNVSRIKRIKSRRGLYIKATIQTCSTSRKVQHDCCIQLIRPRLTNASKFILIYFLDFLKGLEITLGLKRHLIVIMDYTLKLGKTVILITIVQSETAEKL